MCVCVRERERERERDTDTDTDTYFIVKATDPYTRTLPRRMAHENIK